MFKLSTARWLTVCSCDQPAWLDSDVLLAITTISFDIAALEMFLPLITGAKLVLAIRYEALDGRNCRKLTESGATVMQATPSTWKLLLDAGWHGSASFKVLCGGESFDLVELARSVIGGRRFALESLWSE